MLALAMLVLGGVGWRYGFLRHGERRGIREGYEVRLAYSLAAGSLVWLVDADGSCGIRDDDWIDVLLFYFAVFSSSFKRMTLSLSS